MQLVTVNPAERWLVLLTEHIDELGSQVRKVRRHKATSGNCRLAAFATFILAPGSALADSAIDPATKPYFVLGGWVTALLFLGVGFFVLLKAIRNRRTAEAATQWPTADGTVISAAVVKRVSKSGDGFDHFVPQIRYAYEVNGIRRQTDVIRVGLSDMGYREEKKAREHIALYPVGTAIPVRYDPRNPEHAVLETGQIGLARTMLAGCIFASLGIAAIVFAVWIASLPSR
jgi:hypothetical protein